jgi:hypothetical protein
LVAKTVATPEISQSVQSQCSGLAVRSHIDASRTPKKTAALRSRGRSSSLSDQRRTSYSFQSAVAQDCPIAAYSKSGLKGGQILRPISPFLVIYQAHKAREVYVGIVGQIPIGEQRVYVTDEHQIIVRFGLGKALFHLRFRKLPMALGMRCRTGFPTLQHFHQRDK